MNNSQNAHLKESTAVMKKNKASTKVDPVFNIQSTNKNEQCIFTSTQYKMCAYACFPEGSGEW